MHFAWSVDCKVGRFFAIARPPAAHLLLTISPVTSSLRRLTAFSTAAASDILKSSGVDWWKARREGRKCEVDDAVGWTRGMARRGAEQVVTRARIPLESMYRRRLLLNCHPISPRSSTPPRRRRRRRPCASDLPETQVNRKRTLGFCRLRCGGRAEPSEQAERAGRPSRMSTARRVELARGFYEHSPRSVRVLVPLPDEAQSHHNGKARLPFARNSFVHQ